MMLFLYKSYSSLNSSNKILKKETEIIVSSQKLKKIIYLDFSLALYKSVSINNREKKEDFVSFETSNSIHKRYNPYIAYIVKNKKLYRLESLKKFAGYDLGVDSEFDVDFLGEVNSFRVYKSSNKNETYLINIDFKNLDDLLLKVKVFNEL